ncbi:acyltransferase family protein [Luteipulveratus flavus]|uniref:Acyltransferase family protein n=1 Tax=Luteipulveratus flavus TaxID=3031728 RepID=A0ABT6C5U6_9MICO|nr:acyltransferase family protein [Luteipulveratus sp. YIM 133296]MDF8264096.1 acyltransferase family protein [Luteipulveratus sp. YIM 133296]
MDGLRGVAVLAVLVYHVNGSWARGGWLGVDLFFVLSGFLITSLLLQEHRRWGSIDLLGFWMSRARRLLPALVVVLIAVLVAAWFWTVQTRRATVGWDVLSALGYVANWRFIAGDESYFSSIAMPSPVLHMWSLSIEEQYYLAFPLLLTALTAVVRSRRTCAAVLGALALLSVWWMTHLYVPGADPSRVYYGTDTRAFELLIGATAACLLSGRELRRGRPRRTDSVLGIAAWPALAIFMICFLLLPEGSTVPFEGGLALLAVVAVVPIAAASSRTPSAFQRALAFEPLRRLGLISYALYLWHWPVIVFLNPSVMPVDGLALSVVQIVTSLLLASLTFLYVERPIRSRGFAALIPRQPRPSVIAAWSAVPLIVVGALALPLNTSSSSADTPHGSSVTLPQPRYVPSTTTRSVILVGNSIPVSLTNYFDGSSFSDLQVSRSANLGCDPFPGRQYVGDELQVPSAGCVQWHTTWTDKIAETRPDLTLFFVPQTLVSDYEVDGRRIRYGTAEHDRFITASLEHVRTQIAQHGGKRLAISTLSCHDQPDFGKNPEAANVSNIARVRHVNAIATAWARQKQVGVVDTFSAVCAGGFHERVNGVPLYADGLHFTKTSAPIIWNWLAPQLQQLAGRP